MEYERLADELRRAIERRDALRPGTSAHWRAACEAKALMKRVAAAARPYPPVLGSAAESAGAPPIEGS